MTMVWVGQPPVTKETGPGAVAAINTLIQNIRASHSSHMNELRPLGSHMNELRPLGVRRSESWAMAKKYRGFESSVIFDTHRMMTSFMEKQDEKKEYYIYRLDWVPVAVMELQIMGNYVRISNLLTHPLSTGAGGAMVEVAVNATPRTGIPIVELYTVPSAEPAYTAMGFVMTGVSKNMVLDLNKPHPKWICLDGYWKYIPSSGYTSFLAYTHTLPAMESEAKAGNPR
ncbi:MAG: hypothetical protein RPU32_04750 [Candidatus Sedimenticola sp. (ex Thyasira tokunagai)]